MPRLRRANCSTPGIRRKRHGRGFVYVFGDDNRRVEDPEILARIRALAIPPAWTDVWICPHTYGHLQAVGTDAAGRRQYLYHPRWRTRRDQEKFDHMLEFARRVPLLREQCARDLDRGGLVKERVLACAIRLLDRGFFRIGTESYAEQNQSYGLATIQKKHVRLDGNVMTFDYIAKSGKRRLQSILDPEVAEVVAQLKARRGGGPELLAYRDGPRWVDVRSQDINDYIKRATGGDFSAKDFRTWNATVLAAVGLAVSGQAAKSESARKRAITRTIKEVAHYLGNTPAVCRASYIDPRVFDRYHSKWTIQGVLEELGDVDALGEPSTQGAVEAAVLDLLEDNRESPALEKIA